MYLAAVMDLYSRCGNCHDNVVAETFFSLLKKERITRRIYPDRAAASSKVFDYIETFYNAVCQDGFHCRYITGRVRDVTQEPASGCLRKSGPSVRCLTDPLHAELSESFHER
jgi:hypothetical protein